MNAKKQSSIGRPGLVPNGNKDKVVHVGLKMPKSLEDRVIAKASELKKLGFRTNKSELIRFLVEYWLDGAEDLFEERRQKKQRELEEKRGA